MAIVACLLTVLGSKLWLIKKLGSSTPYWDQWDAEGAFLFKPFIDGTLSWWQFIAHHNEHRILFTRLVALGLLVINQCWDPVLEMVANSFIHVAAIVSLLFVILDALDRATFVIFCLFVAVVFAIPFGWENTLAGFQSEFYFLMLFSILSLWLLSKSAGLQPAWWLGLLCSIAAYFNLASGALTVAASVAISIVQASTGHRRGAPEIVAIGVQALLLIVMLADVPTLPGHDALKAHSITQFFQALLSAASWPWPFARIVFVIVMYFPLAIVTISTVRDRRGRGDFRWFVIGVGLWTILQIFSLAYGRAVGTLASRYLDIFLVGIVTNFLCLLIVSEAKVLHPRWWRAAVVATWLVPVSGGLLETAIYKLPSQIAKKRREATEQTNNLSEYLATNDIEKLENKPFLAIPYPSAKRLAEVVALPEIRAILPQTLFDQSVPNFRVSKIDDRPLTTAVVRWLKNLSLLIGPWCLSLGLLFFLVLAVRSRAHPPPRP